MLLLWKLLLSRSPFRAIVARRADSCATTRSSSKASSTDRVCLSGILRNYNTIEDFKNADKAALLASVADEVRSPSLLSSASLTPAQIWERTNSSDEITGSDLNPFLVLTFADLKKYRYWYWCGFPALLQKPGWETEGEWQALEEGLGADEVRSSEQGIPCTSADTSAQASAIHEYQQTTTSAFSLAKPSATGLSFGPLSSFTTFFADTPSADVRPFLYSDRKSVV